MNEAEPRADRASSADRAFVQLCRDQAATDQCLRVLCVAPGSRPSDFLRRLESSSQYGGRFPLLFHKWVETQLKAYTAAQGRSAGAESQAQAQVQALAQAQAREALPSPPVSAPVVAVHPPAPPVLSSTCGAIQHDSNPGVGSGFGGTGTDIRGTGTNDASSLSHSQQSLQSLQGLSIGGFRVGVKAKQKKRMKPSLVAAKPIHDAVLGNINSIRGAQKDIRSELKYAGVGAVG
ncbi:hypothetical protein B484DRAFT_54468, partial [Ochromonadaceae sp. CCMP2298]